MCTNLLVIGASARALAASADRLGLEVNAIDLFGDRDLRDVCSRVVQVSADAYPDDVPSIAAGFPAGPVVYAGGLENHIEVIEKLSRARLLLGNHPRALRLVRDPCFVREVACENGCAYPAIFFTSSKVPRDGTFLRKSTASIGGLGVLSWNGLREEPVRGREYLQQFVSGVPMSASLLVTQEGVELLGVCRQLIGMKWCYAKQFRFCGAIQLSSSLFQQQVLKQLHQFAIDLSRRAKLAGLIGIDFILPRTPIQARDHSPVILEVNPRPTATMELFERRTGRSQAGTHLASLGFQLPRESTTLQRQSNMYWGKAVLFANKSLDVSSSVERHLLKCSLRMQGCELGWPMVSDLPCSGTIIQPGHPIVSVFGCAESPRRALRVLRMHVSEVMQGL
ncbi:MAG: ATP-grasp domain-containing protein [Planctomycetaceae bacterium]|nr:ATP-grasp domain-containing protein [Planctomycetaceae bacterium]